MPAESVIFSYFFNWAMVWRKMAVPLHQKLKQTIMRNTDYNMETLGCFISSDASLQTLKDIISDLDLQFEEVTEL